jgi:DNA-nicking Smr family endonuclease
MILNHFLTMQRIQELRKQTLTPQRVLDLHRLVTEGTLADPADAGRLRPSGMEVLVDDAYGTVFHVPPPAEELPQRLEELCRFANRETPKVFIHPVLRWQRPNGQGPVLLGDAESGLLAIRVHLDLLGDQQGQRAVRALVSAQRERRQRPHLCPAGPGEGDPASHRQPARLSGAQGE